MLRSLALSGVGLLVALGLAAGSRAQEVVGAQSQQDVGVQVQQDLNEAISDYEKAVGAIETDVQAQLAELFDRFADGGELEKAQEVAKHKESFATEGLLSDVPMLKTIREKAKVRFTKANLDLRNAYQRAIAEFTRARDLRSANETKRSFQEFQQGTQPDRLRFPRAATPEKKGEAKLNTADDDAASSSTNAADPKPNPGTPQAGPVPQRQEKYKKPESDQPSRLSAHLAVDFFSFPAVVVSCG